MVINDLKKTCSQCKGMGRTPGISDGGISQINLAGTCPKCGGRGFLLTELGQDLIKLLRPFIEEMMEEARRESTGKQPEPEHPGESGRNQ